MTISFKNLILLTISTIILSSTNCSSEILDKIIVIVNNDVITMSEVAKAGKPIFTKIARENNTDQQSVLIKEANLNIINQLIDKKLIEQQARARKIKVSPEEINKAIQQIVQSNGLTSEQFAEQLKLLNTTVELYRNRLHSQILRNRTLSLAVRPNIIINDDDIVEYYDENFTKRVKSDSYYLLQFGIPAQANNNKTANENKEEAFKSVKRFHTLIVNGQDFKELAKKFSKLPSANHGGDIGIFTKDEMAPYMLKAVDNLKPGQTSEIIETSSGYQFFQLVSSSKAGGIILLANFDAVRDNIYQILFEKKFKIEAKTWLNKIKSTAYIKRI